MAISALVVCLTLSSCSEDGDQGPVGPGSTQTLYSAAIPAYTSNPSIYIWDFDISAPALTAQSDVQVYLSSNTVDYVDWGWTRMNVNAKTIHVTLQGGSADAWAGWMYYAYVQNPS